MINATFTAGGAACTWKTIEATTGIHIDHFIQIDFSGFKRMVDALGGVQICLPRAIDDPKSRLKLSAGRHQVKGDTALAYVRTRYGIGDGSDLGRIKRQQLFMASVVHKATSSDLVTDPTRLYGFLDATTKSITTDDDLGVGTLRKIADSVRGMSSGKVRFLTVPNHYWEVDPNRVVWTQPDAQHLFDAVKNDNVAPTTPAPTTSPPTPAPAGSAAPQATDRTRLGTVGVRVVDGTGRTGLATEVSAALRAAGFTRARPVTTPPATRAARTTIRAGATTTSAANTLRALLTGKARTLTTTDTATITLILGQDWPATGTGLRPTTALPTPTAAPTAAQPAGVSGDTDSCRT
jgi:LCP family protein required for cell wall assembly